MSAQQEENQDLNNLLAKINKTFATTFEPLQIDGQVIYTLDIANMTGHLDMLLQTGAIRNPLKDLPLWAKVWPAAPVLGRFLRKFSPAGKSLLEIGAGLGVCGLIASHYGFENVTITDVNPMAVDFIKAEILRNDLQHVARAALLDIKHSGHPGTFDFIAGTEIFYLQELHRPILKFLQKTLAENGKAIFCTDLSRQSAQFQKLASRDFAVTEGHIGVKENTEDGDVARRIYKIMILERK